MTLTKVIPIIESLTPADKFKLMKFILSQLEKEEDMPPIPLETQVSKKEDALWDIVGMAEGEDAGVARQHDKYLYGVK
ncbi:MAG: hypothetical protein GY864_06155 [Desulfobacterales bacterium]|nr:hypothetical protein [Desulfobacterales bacterium]